MLARCSVSCYDGKTRTLGLDEVAGGDTTLQGLVELRVEVALDLEVGLDILLDGLARGAVPLLERADGIRDHWARVSMFDVSGDRRDYSLSL